MTFLRWIVRKFVDTDEKRRANRQQLYETGGARTPVLYNVGAVYLTVCA